MVSYDCDALFRNQVLVVGGRAGRPRRCPRSSPGYVFGVEIKPQGKIVQLGRAPLTGRVYP